MSFISQTSLLEENRVVLRGVRCNSDIQVKDWVRIDPLSGYIVKAIADDFMNSRVVGVVEEKLASTVANVLVMGLSKDVFSGLITNKHYFLSDAVQGDMTINPITVSGHVLMNLGMAVSPTRLLVRIDQGIVRG